MPQKIFIALAASFVCAIAGPAKAAEFRCDRSQTSCSVESRSLTIGDHVGFFDRDNQLLAHGRVEKVEQRTRHIKIEKRYGDIADDSTFRRIDDEKMQNLAANYKIFRAPSQWLIGGDVGLASVGLGSGAIGFGGTGYASWLARPNVYLTGRGLFMTASGEAMNANVDAPAEAFQVTIFGAVPTLQWISPQHKAISGRIEAGLGLAYASVSLSGGNAKEYLDHVESGIGLAMRGSIGAQLNLEDWRPTIDFAVNRVQTANFQVISLGVVRDFK